MIDQEYNIEYIPDVISQSEESSYRQALREATRRYNALQERRIQENSDSDSDESDFDEMAEMDQIGRTAQQIREYMRRERFSIREIDDIPEVIARSRESSYHRAAREVARRRR